MLRLIMCFCATFVFSSDTMFVLRCPSIHQKAYDKGFDNFVILPNHRIFCKRIIDEAIHTQFIDSQGDESVFQVGSKQLKQFEVMSLFENDKKIVNTIKRYNDKIEWAYYLPTAEPIFNFVATFSNGIFCRNSNLPTHFNAIPYEPGIYTWDKNTLNIIIMNKDSLTNNMRIYYRRFTIDEKHNVVNNKFKCCLAGTFHNIFALSHHKFLLEIMDKSKDISYILLRYNLTNLDFQQEVLNYKKLLAISRTTALWLDHGSKENSILTLHSLTDQKSRKFFVTSPDKNIYSCFANNETALFIGHTSSTAGDKGLGICANLNEIFDNKDVPWRPVVWNSDVLRNAFDLFIHKKIIIHPNAIRLDELSSDNDDDMIVLMRVHDELL